jgi:hypothetical protein
MHKYAAPTALAIALNITILALAVSASLTTANAMPGSGNRPCGWPDSGAQTGTLKCACYFQCKRAPLPEGCGRFGCHYKPIAACMAKCVAAKEAARH